jgi:hypothetical protein
MQPAVYPSLYPAGSFGPGAAAVYHAPYSPTPVVQTVRKIPLTLRFTYPFYLCRPHRPIIVRHHRPRHITDRSRQLITLQRPRHIMDNNTRLRIMGSSRRCIMGSLRNRSRTLKPSLRIPLERHVFYRKSALVSPFTICMDLTAIVLKNVGGDYSCTLKNALCCPVVRTIGCCFGSCCGPQICYDSQASLALSQQSKGMPSRFFVRLCLIESFLS